MLPSGDSGAPPVKPWLRRGRGAPGSGSSMTDGVKILDPRNAYNDEIGRGGSSSSSTRLVGGTTGVGGTGVVVDDIYDIDPIAGGNNDPLLPASSSRTINANAGRRLAGAGRTPSGPLTSTSAALAGAAGSLLDEPENLQLAVPSMDAEDDAGGGVLATEDAASRIGGAGGYQDGNMYNPGGSFGGGMYGGYGPGRGGDVDLFGPTAESLFQFEQGLALNDVVWDVIADAFDWCRMSLCQKAIPTAVAVVSRLRQWVIPCDTDPEWLFHEGRWIITNQGHIEARRILRAERDEDRRYREIRRLAELTRLAERDAELLLFPRASSSTGATSCFVTRPNTTSSRARVIHLLKKKDQKHWAQFKRELLLEWFFDFLARYRFNRLLRLLGVLFLWKMYLIRRRRKLLAQQTGDPVAQKMWDTLATAAKLRQATATPTPAKT
ncbi:unnamed protein product [Amoebophrya sp. A25]|nr:unnamed protein product [Amoebophrya sp. A25]|eukprot:GSA25T00027010001.1